MKIFGFGSAAVVAVGLFAGLAYADSIPQMSDSDSKRLIALDDIDIGAICKTAQDKYHELIEDKKLDRKDHTAQDEATLRACPQAVRKHHDQVCENMPGFCLNHVVGGIELWFVGGEINFFPVVPVLSTRTELRVNTGMGFFKTLQENSGRLGRDIRILGSVTVNDVLGRDSWIGYFKKPAEGAEVNSHLAPNRPESSIEPDRFQIFLGGLSLVWIPASEGSKVYLNDIVSEPKLPNNLKPNSSAFWQTTGYNVLAMLKSGLIGVEGEARVPGQSDAFQNSALEGSFVTNANGGLDPDQHAVIFNLLHSLGKIRTQNVSLQFTSVVDVAGLFNNQGGESTKP